MTRNLRFRLHRLFGFPYRLYAADSGGSGTAIVLLHGLGTNSSNWKNVTPSLADKYRVISIDLLGFGKSPKPDNINYTPDDHIASIHYTLHKLRVRKPFILVGHSMGAILAVHYANRYRDNVSRLVLCSLPLYRYAKISNRLAAMWAQQGDKTLLSAYERFRGNKELTLKAATMLKRAVPGLIAFELSDETWYPFYQSLHNTIESQELSPLIANIDVPVHLVYGRLDPLINIANLVYLAKNNPQISVRVAATSGHELSKPLAAKVVGAITTENTAGIAA